MTEDHPSARGSGSAQPLLPPIDVFEDTAGITLLVDMPGVARDGLEISVEGETLTIEGRVDLPTAPMDLIHAELRALRYRRSFALSRELAADRIDALLKDGVLRLSIPKREQARPHRIAVRTA
jgi:HSP20 family molecular chaperone IbpA